MEYLDILDEEGNKIGIKSRQDVHRDGDWHKVAFIFVVNDKGEIILQKRSKEKESNPNKWTASASGHLSAGDTEFLFFFQNQGSNDRGIFSSEYEYRSK